MSAEKKKMHGLRILRTGGSEVTRERNPDDEWDQDDTRAWTDVQGLEIAEDARMADLAIPFEPEEGESLYLLSVTYSTGDSFSRSEGLFDAIAAYRTEEKALRAAATIEAHSDREGGAWRYHALPLEAEDGSLFQASVSWIGYFESLDGVNVDKLKVQDARKPKIRSPKAR